MFVYLRLRKVSHFFVNNLRLTAQIVLLSLLVDV